MTLTVGQLKELIKDMDDNAKVITTSSNYELRGSMVDARTSVDKFKEHMEGFRDDFDGSCYSSKVYRRSGEGEQALVIWG